MIQRQAQIRKLFLSSKNPYQYISYKDFLQHFVISKQNFKQQNLNIIDIHLRYRWYVRQKMAPYKWITILSLTPLFFKSTALCIIIPIFTVKMFDNYFQRFFIWRYRNQRIIDIKRQFVTKLSKQKNYARRIMLFQRIKNDIDTYYNQKIDKIFMKNKESLVDNNKEVDDKQSIQKRNAQQIQKLNKQSIQKMTKQRQQYEPLKYIKFGQFTQYLFHAKTQNKQQSSILQTTIFQNYLSFKNIISDKKPFQFLKQVFKQFKQDFLAFKNDQTRKKYIIDIDNLIQNDQIKHEQIYTLQQNIDHNVRRFSQIWQFQRRNSLEPSNFNLWQYTNFSRYQDIYDRAIYNVKDNKSDLALYYSVIIVPKLLSFIFKRR